MDALILVLAQALDMVEISYLGASTNHGKRIAVLCAAMGRHLGIKGDELSDLVSCALLHDNALTEFILLQQGREEDAVYLGAHCEIGQRNVEVLPFKGNISGYIHFHHERANGQGPFKMSEGYYPLGAELIAAADMIDVERHLQRIAPVLLPLLREDIEDDIHHRFTGRAGNALLAVLDEELLASLQDDRIEETIRRSVPDWTMDMENPALVPIAELIARIIDYKSTFTRLHTQQIANRAWVMAEYYGYNLTDKIQLYLAAALHDIGKLAIPSAVLEKPGKLNDEEFEIIKTHIVHTRNLLCAMKGHGPIIEWASNHHEKLDGSGYPLGKTAAELDFNSRLMACIDIYQAVSEERPYHPRRSHTETMPILNSMAEKGGIDPAIVRDMDKVMASYSLKDVETPKL
ncbi:HD family phosphohydrolase [Spirochaetia bacterium]|nr:HD family phosphohydrolase [Spirochaetia bacterium]